MVHYYHYTSAANLQQIKKCGYILPSQDTTKDCRYGTGVYFTTLDPEDHSKEELARNNYRSGYQKGLDEGKLECYIQIEIQDGEHDPFRKCPDGRREVYVANRLLRLQDYNWDSGMVKQWSPFATAVLAVGAMALVGKAVYDGCQERKKREKEKKQEEDPGECILQ